MNQEQLNRILRLVNRTGDKFIVADRETDGVFVVMDMLDYEEMQGIYDGNDADDFLGDDLMDDDDDDLFDDFLSHKKDHLPGEFLAAGEDLEDDEENLSEISQKNDFSPNFLAPEDKIAEKVDFVEDLDKKDDYHSPETTQEELPRIPAKNVNPSYASVGQLLKNKDFLKEEPVLEEINPMAELHGLTEDASETTVENEEDLDTEDRDRFYLEPV